MRLEKLRKSLDERLLLQQSHAAHRGRMCATTATRPTAAIVQECRPVDADTDSQSKVLENVAKFRGYQRTICLEGVRDGSASAL